MRKPVQVQNLRCLCCVKASKLSRTFMNSCPAWSQLSSGEATSLKSLDGPMLVQNCLLVPQTLGVCVSCGPSMLIRSGRMVLLVKLSKPLKQYNCAGMVLPYC